MFSFFAFVLFQVLLLFGRQHCMFHCFLFSSFSVTFPAAGNPEMGLTTGGCPQQTHMNATISDSYVRRHYPHRVSPRNVTLASPLTQKWEGYWLSSLVGK